MVTVADEVDIMCYMPMPGQITTSLPGMRPFTLLVARQEASVTGVVPPLCVHTIYSCNEPSGSIVLSQNNTK